MTYSTGFRLNAGRSRNILVKNIFRDKNKSYYCKNTAHKSKVDHRIREANISTSSGHNFFKSGPVEKRTTVLDSPYPIVKYMYYVSAVFLLFHSQNFVRSSKTRYKGVTRADSVPSALSLERTSFIAA